MLPIDTEQVYTVSKLNRELRVLLEDEYPAIWVRGEVSNLRVQRSGHSYFTLKDEDAQLSCVLFASRGWYASQGRAPRGGAGSNQPDLRDGMMIKAQGRISIYEPRGQYQLILESYLEEGQGELQARFEALKRKLAGEGLFDAQRKRALPRFPVRVGVVTSPSGAAIRDFLHVLERRAPWVRIVLAPVAVQGASAAGQIVRGIEDLNAWHAQQSTGAGLDLLVITRGGGSLEDLWPFNEEAVARAVAASELPVVSAVGHEIDFAISDFAADLRAPTPSAAAEMIAPDGEELRDRFENYRGFLNRRLRDYTEQRRKELQWLRKGALQREPLRIIREWQQRLDAHGDSLDRLMRDRLSAQQERLENQRHRLENCSPARLLPEMRRKRELLHADLREALGRAMERLREPVRRNESLLRVLGPQSVLDRGFSITLTEEGEVVDDPAQVPEDTLLVTQVKKGEIRSRRIK